MSVFQVIWVNLLTPIYRPQLINPNLLTLIYRPQLILPPLICLQGPNYCQHQFSNVNDQGLNCDHCSHYSIIELISRFIVSRSIHSGPAATRIE